MSEPLDEIIHRSFKIGDHVKFLANRHKTGIVRYIGSDGIYPSQIGIELDEWSINGHDGSVNGEQIFDTSPGRGTFVRRDEIENYDPHPVIKAPIAV